MRYTVIVVKRVIGLRKYVQYHLIIIITIEPFYNRYLFTDVVMLPLFPLVPPKMRVEFTVSAICG